MSDDSDDSRFGLKGLVPNISLFGGDEEEDEDTAESVVEPSTTEPDDELFGDDDIEVEEPSQEEEAEDQLVTDYVDFDWDEQWSKAVDKINRASEGDQQAYADVSAAPGRMKDYFLHNTIPRDTILDVLLPMTLAGYGFLLIVMSFVVGGLFTSPSRIADIFIIDTIILTISVVLFVYARQKSDLASESSLDVWRRKARSILFVFHLIPTILIAWIVGVNLFGGGISSGVDWFIQTLSFWRDVSPAALTNIGSAIWESTPIGMTLQEIGIVMLVVGVVGSIPFLLAMLKVLIIAINVGGVKVDDEAEEEKVHEDLMAAAEGVGTVEVPDEAEEDEDLILPKRAQDITENNVEDALQEIKSRLTLLTEMDELEDIDEHLLEIHDDFEIRAYNGTYVEIDRYWLKEPYSYVAILYNQQEDDHRYYSIEPQLNSIEDELYREFRSRMETALRSESVDSQYEEDMVDEKKREILEEQIFEIATEYDITLSDLSLQKIMYYVERDYIGYRDIDVLMNDTNVEDISCVGPNEAIWVNHSEYENMMTNIQFEKNPLKRFIGQLAQRSGEQISAATPMQDATLPDGSRAQLTLGSDITTHGSTFTIRQFQDIPFTPVDLIRTETFGLTQMAYLWLCIQNNKSLIFAGGTASGKTTSMNAMSLFIPPKAKVVTLEDTREITLPHKNWIPGKTREGTSQEGDAGDEITMYDLLKAALRQRPEYLVVGEVRGNEAQTLFQAMSTGHTTYSTMHADSIKEAINRLENDPINVPPKMVNALDIMCVQRRLIIKGDYKRRNIEVAEIYDVSGSEETDRKLQTVFERDPGTDSWLNRTETSRVLENIQRQNTWTPEQLRDEIDRRKKVLKYLYDKNVYQFESVTRVIQKYMSEDDKGPIMQSIADGTLDPEEIEDVTDAEIEDVRKRMQADKTESILQNRGAFD